MYAWDQYIWDWMINQMDLRRCVSIEFRKLFRFSHKKKNWWRKLLERSKAFHPKCRSDLEPTLAGIFENQTGLAPEMVSRMLRWGLVDPDFKAVHVIAAESYCA